MNEEKTRNAELQRNRKNEAREVWRCSVLVIFLGRFDHTDGAADNHSERLTFLFVHSNTFNYFARLITGTHWFFCVNFNHYNKFIIGYRTRL